jgi:hypothetical protein
LEYGTVEVFNENIVKQIREFRKQRISLISADQEGDLPVQLAGNKRIVFHVISPKAFEFGKAIELRYFEQHLKKLITLCNDVQENVTTAAGFNFEGFLSTSTLPKAKSPYGYTLFFRHGIVEAVDTYLLESRGSYIIAASLESELIKAFFNFVQQLEGMNIKPPIVVALTLLGVKGYQLYRPGQLAAETKIRTDILEMPEIIVQNYSDAPPRNLRPLFDMVWNVFGYPRSLNYNEENEWQPP